MKYLRLIIFIIFTVSLSQNTVVLSLIQKYLQIVYPTSNEIKQMNAKQAKIFYENLHFWYRVPTKDHPDGLFSENIQPYYGIFLFPDTTATDGKAGVDFGQDGIMSEKNFHGSNKNYIEVTSFGWMMFPYGGFFNWAPGSGIYLNTGGKVIQAYTRIDLLYTLYKEKNELPLFYKKLSANALVNKEIYGNQSGLKQALFKQLCLNKNLAYQTKLPTLIASLKETNHWGSIAESFCSSTSLEQANNILLNIFVADHVSGKFIVSSKRYNYMIQEATAELDQWGYIMAKKAGHNVIEYTKAPNSGGTTNFEIDDLRWPMVENKQAGNNAMYQGTQRYNLKYVWQKAIDNGWLQQRDPLDLNNDKKARPIVMSWPHFSSQNCAINSGCHVRKPTPSFPASWLNKGGWNMAVCKQVGCFPTERYIQWKTLKPCPTPLKLDNHNNLCHLVSFALDSAGSESFSMIDPAYNKNLIMKNRKTSPGSK